MRHIVVPLRRLRTTVLNLTLAYSMFRFFCIYRKCQNSENNNQVTFLPSVKAASNWISSCEFLKCLTQVEKKMQVTNLCPKWKLQLQMPGATMASYILVQLCLNAKFIYISFYWVIKINSGNEIWVFWPVIRLMWLHLFLYFILA